MNRFKIHKSHDSNMYVWLLIYGFLFSFKLQSQTKDTAQHQLQEVIILQTKQQQFETSKKQTAFDSLTLNRYNTTSLADLLANQSTIHIKSYGNGNIVSTSMRGGNANHTALTMEWIKHSKYDVRST
jgi:hypothetical protein